MDAPDVTDDPATGTPMGDCLSVRLPRTERWHRASVGDHSGDLAATWSLRT